MSDVQLTSMLTCPVCGHRASEAMPTDACQYFYECRGCHAVLRPKAGDWLRVLLLRLATLSADTGGARRRCFTIVLRGPGQLNNSTSGRE